MSRKDWLFNPIHKVLRSASLWPFKYNELDGVLDVACGLSLKSQYLDCTFRVGVDIHEPYLRAIECHSRYAVLKYDVRRLNEIFMENSFDAVYALDIIEHLEKEESLDLIAQCKKIAKRAVVIETPEGYIPQNLDIQGFEAHEYQTHRCGWEVSELNDLGFECVVRPYEMQDVQRHTELDVDIHVNVISGIFLKER